MPNIHNNYCYQTLNEIANNIVSSETHDHSAGITFYTGYTVGLNAISFTQSYKTATTTASQTTYGVVVRTFPYCSVVGPISSQTTLSAEDTVIVSGLVMLSLAMAWSLKALRRAL